MLKSTIKLSKPRQLTLKPFRGSTSHLRDDDIDAKGHRVSLKFITPAVARKILADRNSTPSEKEPAYTNRNLRPQSKKTKLMVKDIEEGNFYPSLIKFSRKGVLLDGQHRLHAIIAADVKAKMIVETGANPTSMIKIDRGNPRTQRDILGLTVLQDWDILPSRWAKAKTIGINWFAWQEAVVATTCRNGGKKRKGSFASNLLRHNPTDDEVTSFYKKNRKQIEWASNIQLQATSGLGRLNNRAFMVPMTMLYNLSPELAKELFHKVIGKNSHTVNSAASRIRKLCLEESQADRSLYLEVATKVMGCIQRYIDGKPMQGRIPKTYTLKKGGA